MAELRPEKDSSAESAAVPSEVTRSSTRATPGSPLSPIRRCPRDCDARDSTTVETTPTSAVEISPTITVTGSITQLPPLEKWRRFSFFAP